MAELSDIDLLLTSQQVQIYLKISRSKLYRMIESGVLPRRKIGRASRFYFSDVQRCLIPQVLKQKGYSYAAPTIPNGVSPSRHARPN